MGILGKLMEKPWLVKGAGEASPANGGNGSKFYAVRTALRLYLAIVTFMFALITGAYLMRMGLIGHGELEDPVFDWQPMPEPGILWINTAILFLSSIALDRASSAAFRGRAGAMKVAVFLGGVLAVVFLLGQLAAWQQLAAAGYFINSNPANAFFYFITAVHGLHILGGLVALNRVISRVWRGFELSEIGGSIYLCAIYWHFLLLVWLLMFGLMLYT